MYQTNVHIIGDYFAPEHTFHISCMSLLGAWTSLAGRCLSCTGVAVGWTFDAGDALVGVGTIAGLGLVCLPSALVCAVVCCGTVACCGGTDTVAEGSAAGLMNLLFLEYVPPVSVWTW